MLTDEEKQILLETARLSILKQFGKVQKDFPEATDSLKKGYGAFVTLNKGGHLRGCIGLTASTKPLLDTVKEVAQSSAFKDSRFPAVDESEVNDLEIEVSVLSPLKKVENINEIKVGVHGIMVKKGFHSGLLLPEVAVEYGWDRDTFLTHTCHKAGLPGGAWKQDDVTISIFHSMVCSEKKFEPDSEYSAQ